MNKKKKTWLRMTLLNCSAAVILLHVQFSAASLDGKDGMKYKDTTGYLPDLNTQEHFEVLNKSFNKVVPLVNALDEGNGKIRNLLEEYRANPTFENQARMEKAMAGQVATILDVVDGFLGTRDEVLWALSGLKRELGNFSGKIGKYTAEVQLEVRSYRERVDAIDREVVALAHSIKQDPENQELREGFRKKLFEMRFAERRYDENLKKAKLMKTWGETFVNLQESISNLNQEVSVFMDSLEDEREMLAWTVKTRAESVELTRKIRDGLVVGENSVAEIAKKIQRLYAGMENFVQVSEGIDSAFTGKNPTQSAVNELIGSLDSVTSGEKGVESELDRYVRE